MLESYSNSVLRYRWFVLIVVCALAVLAGNGTRHLKISSNLEIFFPQDDPQVIGFNKFRDEFTSDDNIMFPIAPADGVIFSQRTLGMIEEFTERAWQMPYAQRVDSITNFQHTRADGDDLLVAPLIEYANEMTDEQIAEAFRVALAEPLLNDRMINSRGHATGVFVTINLPKEGKADAIRAVVTDARAMRDEFHERYPEITIRVGGKVAGNNAFSEATLYDLRTIVPLALLIALLCIGAYLIYASGSVVSAICGVFAVVVVIVLSVTTAMGMAGYLGYAVTPPMGTAPTMILTLAVADAMHLLVMFFQRLRLGDDKRAAMAQSLRLNFRAVFLTSLTTVIGFLALNASDSPPFGELGNTVAIGIAAAWIVSITVFPALIVILPMRLRKGRSDDVKALEALADRVIRYRKTLALGVVVLALACVALLPRNQFYDVWAEYFEDSVEARAAIKFMNENLTGMNSMEFPLSAGEPGGISEPEFLRRVDAFADFMRSQPEVLYVSSLVEIMERLNRNMNGDDPAFHKLPESRELAAQYLLLYELSLPFGLDLTNQVNIDKSSLRVTVILKDSSTNTVFHLQDISQQWFAENSPPEFGAFGTSSDVMFAIVGRATIISMLTGAAIGLAAISLVILIAMRSVKLGLLSFVSNCLPIIMGFGIWGLTNGRVGMGLSVVFGITMGIVVDYTVHLLSKYQLGQRDHQFDTPQAIRYAFSTVGVALVITSIILVVNFGLLLFSDFVLNSEMGTLTAIIIMLALVVDLFLVPPILLFMDRRRLQPDRP